MSAPTGEVLIDCWRSRQLRALFQTKTDDAFMGELSRIADELGFEYCSYTMRAPMPVAAARTLELNNYSPAWQIRYIERNYGAIDPARARGAQSVLPFVWSDELFEGTPAFRDDARAHGIEIGWSQSCYDGKGLGGLLTLARSRDAISQSELQLKTDRMSWLVQAAHETLAERMLAKLLPEASVSLTTREIDVLRWSADGHTASEVSDILDISERTVNFHVNNSLTKLNALNKTAAVVKATRLGLL